MNGADTTAGSILIRPSASGRTAATVADQREIGEDRDRYDDAHVRADTQQRGPAIGDQGHDGAQISPTRISLNAIHATSRNETS
jgi:hypothetical protein